VISSILPSRNLTTVFASEAASGLWVAIMVAVFCSRVRRRSNSRITLPVVVSRLPVVRQREGCLANG